MAGFSDPPELSKWLGDPIEDAAEESFLLFSQDIPSRDLGTVDSKAPAIDFDLAHRQFVVRQSPGVLNSSRRAGTTGAVVWSITPLVAEWLASPNLLGEAGILHSDATVVEVGCGIGGLLGLVLAPKIRQYILTDQPYIMKALHANIAANMPSQRTKRSESSRCSAPDAVPLDWETDTPSRPTLGLQKEQNINLVIACDCVYNDHLIKPLVETLAAACRLNAVGYTATVMVAQQLRSDEVMEKFLSTLLESFYVWQIPNHRLPPSLAHGSGYVVHLAQLKQGLS